MYIDPERQRQFQREHYQRNKERYGMSQKINRIRTKLMVYKFLKEHPCVHCGETDPVVLEFHHRDGEQKEATIAYLVRHRWARVAGEIAKCDVTCANCHRRHHNKSVFENLERLLVSGEIDVRSPEEGRPLWARTKTKKQPRRKRRNLPLSA